MTRNEVNDKLWEADKLLTEIQSYVHGRFTGARTSEQHDHCFGYSLGVVVASVMSARDAITKARGQMVHVADTPTT